MSPPVHSATQTPTNSNPPEESPEIKAARERYREAGYTRNQAEVAYKQAVQDGNGEAVKNAKMDLEKAQAEVDKCMHELMKLLGLNWKFDGQAEAPKKKKETPTKIVREELVVQHRNLEKLVKGEYFPRASSEIVRIIEVDKKYIKEITKRLEELKKNPPKSMLYEYQYQNPPRAERVINRSYLRAVLHKDLATK